MSKSLYEYAKEIDKRNHISFYDVYSCLLKNIDCVVCLESAADLLGYSNGGYREKIQVFTTKKYHLPYLECYVVNDLNIINYNQVMELKVTPIEDTIIDLLGNPNTDEQILLEALANYYYENNQSYSKLNITPSLQAKFDYYSKESKLYYES